MDALYAAATAPCSACPHPNWLVADSLTMLEARVLGVSRGMTVERHIATQCHLTARLVRHLVAGSEAWARVNAPTGRIFQVELYPLDEPDDEDDEDYGCSDPDHVFTVCDGAVLQSWWGEYEARVTTPAAGSLGALIATATATIDAWSAIIGQSVGFCVKPRFLVPGDDASLDPARIAERRKALESVQK